MPACRVCPCCDVLRMVQSGPGSCFEKFPHDGGSSLASEHVAGVAGHVRADPVYDRNQNRPGHPTEVWSAHLLDRECTVGVREVGETSVPGRSLGSGRVAPGCCSAHTPLRHGPAAVLAFGQAAGLGVVHLASLSGGVFLDGPNDVASYVRAFTRRAAALSPAESSQLLRT